MSKPPRKHGTIRIHDKPSELPIHNLHEMKINKFLPESDIIVHSILEKIYSLVISGSFKNKIENQFNETCFHFIKKTINNYLTYYYLPYDNEGTKYYDDSIFNSKNDTLSEIDPINKSNISNIKNNDAQIEQSLLFNNFVNGENDWDIMEEPFSNNFDRYASTLITYKNIDNEGKERFKLKGEEILEEISEDSEKKSEDGNEKNSNNISNSKENNNKNNVSNNNNFSKSIYKKNDGEKKKKKVIDINQFSFHDLADDTDHYIESGNIDYEKLRKEMEEKQKIVSEEKKENDKVKIKIEKKLREEAERNKKYIGKKITVDVDGNVIFVKGIKIDKLNKDFFLLKTSTKTYRENNETNTSNKKKVNKKKLENNNDANTNLIPETENTKNDNNTENKVKNKKGVVYNNNDDDSKNVKFGKFLPKLDTKIKSKNKFLSSANPPDDQKSRIQQRIEEGPIIPSGSNFEIMNMEIGVSIKENKKFKTGGKDFYLKYNKYSLENYNKQLKRTLEVNNVLLNTHQEIEINNTNTDMNYNDTYGSSYGFTNPNFNTQNNKNYMTGKNFNTTSNFGLKTASNNMLKNSNNNSSMNPLIKLKGGTSLMGSIDKLNLITEREEHLARKTMNLFKKNNSLTKRNKRNIKDEFNEINKFTTEILTSKNWTNDSHRDILNSEPKAITTRKILGPNIRKEMEFRNLNFRNRTKHKNQMSSPALDAALFFK